jgi:hypothetical protein
LGMGIWGSVCLGMLITVLLMVVTVLLPEACCVFGGRGRGGKGGGQSVFVYVLSELSKQVRRVPGGAATRLQSRVALTKAYAVKLNAWKAAQAT